MKKRVVSFLCVVPLALGACAAPAVPSSDETMESPSSAMMEKSSSESMKSDASSSDSMMQKSSEAAVMPTSSDDTPTSSESTASARVIEVAVTNFAFSPSSISVKKGEKVVLRLKGETGVHGIAIPDLGVSVRVELGKTVDVVLNTDATGSFSFYCNVPCGPGHKGMKGSIVIS